MSFHEPAILGRTGLKVGRLGVASGYGMPAAAIEEAFERGCNYFTWGTVIKGYSAYMRQALKNIVAKGQRDRLVLAAFTYAHNNFLTERLLARGLKSAGLDHADILILGYFSRKPPRRLIDGALRMKERGLARFIGLSSHNRKLLGELAGSGEFDVMHLRYNAAHRGAETEIFPLSGGRTAAWDRVLHRHPMGQAPRPEEDAAGRTAADGRGLLPLRSLESRGRRLHLRRQDG